MKKLFTLLALLLTFIFTNAQTAEETLECLKAKKVNIEHNRSSSTTVSEFGKNLKHAPTDHNRPGDSITFKPIKT